MILVDTSVWVDHLRAGDEKLARALEEGRVLTHPFVIGEISLGNLRQRDVVINALLDLPQAKAATDREVLQLIKREALHGLGLGYIDAHLLAAARLAAGASLWSRDKPLLKAAARLGLAVGG